MTVTTHGLTRAAAVAAALAGAIFAAVQINHPPMEVASAETTEWVLRNTAKAVMAALALAGVTGVYLRLHRRAGLLGLAGYLLFCTGLLAMMSVALVAAFVLPALTGTEPAWVGDVLVAAEGGKPAGDIGGIQVLFAVSGAGYLGGGVLFGATLFRVWPPARWAAALLVLGALGTAALAVLPESFNRPVAIPVAVALAGLGVALWRDGASAPAPVAASPSLQPAAR